MASLLWLIATFWAVVYAVRGARTRSATKNVLPGSVEQGRKRHNSRVEVQVTTFEIRAETTVLNDKHDFIMDFLDQESNAVLKRVLSAFYNIGSVVGAVGLVLGFVVLAWTPLQLLYSSLSHQMQTSSNASGVYKRDLSDTRNNRGSSTSETRFSINPLVSDCHYPTPSRK